MSETPRDQRELWHEVSRTFEEFGEALRVHLSPDAARSPSDPTRPSGHRGGAADTEPAPWADPARPGQAEGFEDPWAAATDRPPRAGGATGSTATPPADGTGDAPTPGAATDAGAGTGVTATGTGAAGVGSSGAGAGFGPAAGAGAEAEGDPTGTGAGPTATGAGAPGASGTAAGSADAAASGAAATGTAAGATGTSGTGAAGSGGTSSTGSGAAATGAAGTGGSRTGGSGTGGSETGGTGSSGAGEERERGWREWTESAGGRFGGPADWDSARESVRDFGSSVRRIATQAGDAARDPQVRDSAQRAARTLGDAIVTTVEDFATELRERMRNPRWSDTSRPTDPPPVAPIEDNHDDKP